MNGLVCILTGEFDAKVQVMNCCCNTIIKPLAKRARYC